MNINWNLLFTALGLAMVLEALPYFLFAERMPRVLRLLSEQKPNALRMMGLMVLLGGLLLLYVCRG